MIEIIGIVAGVGALVLGFLSLRDLKSGQNEFAPIETEGLHSSWGWVFKVQRFNGYLNLFSYFALGPLAIALGLYALLK